MSIVIDSQKINLARTELTQSLQLVQKLAGGILSNLDADYTKAVELLSAATSNLASGIFVDEPMDSEEPVELEVHEESEPELSDDSEA